MNGTDARGEEAAVALALSVAITVISAVGLLLNAYILFVIVITKQKTMSEKRYTKDAMAKAVDAVSKGVTASAAAKEFGVPRTTLLDKVSGRSDIDASKGPPTILTKQEEEHLKNWILYMADRGFPVRKEQLLDSVAILVRKLNRKNPFHNDRPGRHWYEAFIKRYPEVGVRVAQNLTQSRAMVTEEDIRLWFNEIENYIHLAQLNEALQDPRRIFNCDESAFLLSPSDNTVLAKRGSKNVYNVTPSGEKECLTVLITANAAGELAPPLVLFRLKTIPHKIATSSPGGWALGHAPKGWMTGESFYEYMTNVLYPWIEKNNIPLPIIFFLDGHCSHTTLPLSNFCREKNIVLIALYPNATHLLQPMDVSVFRPLKKIWKKVVYDWRNENQFKKLKKEDFCPLLNDALKQLDRNVITNGFRKCGLSPLNANNVDYSKCVTKAIKQTESDQMNSINMKKNHLEYFESQISPTKLKAIQENEGPIWKGDHSLKELFAVWKKIKCHTSDTTYNDNHENKNDITGKNQDQILDPTLTDLNIGENLSSFDGNFTGLSDILNTNCSLNNISGFDLQNETNKSKCHNEAGKIELFEVIDGNLSKIQFDPIMEPIKSDIPIQIESDPTNINEIQHQVHGTISETIPQVLKSKVIRTTANNPIYLTPAKKKSQSQAMTPPLESVSSSYFDEILPIQTTSSINATVTSTITSASKPSKISGTNSVKRVETPQLNLKNKFHPYRTVTSPSKSVTSLYSSEVFNNMPSRNTKVTSTITSSSMTMTLTSGTEQTVTEQTVTPLQSSNNRNNHQLLSTPFKNIPTPFKEALFWPEASKAPDDKKKVKIPSVITSDRWQIFTQKKRDEKAKKEKEANSRRMAKMNKKQREEQKVIPKKVGTCTGREIKKSLKGTKENDWYCRLCKTCSKLDMIQCLSCEVWYHTSCASVRPNEKSFFCRYCQA